MHGTQRPASAGADGGRTAYWVIAVLLAVIAGVLLGRSSGSGVPAAWAQNRPLAGAGGVYAFTGQLDQNRYGLFMLDVDQGTIWCYEIDSSGGTRKLRLIAARSWVYDRYLQDFNCASPDFRTVQELVARQRGQAPGPGQISDAQAERGDQRPPEADTGPDGRRNED